MQSKKERILLYVISIIVILAIAYYSILPAVQSYTYQKSKYYLLNKDSETIDYDRFAMRINTSEKNTIVLDALVEAVHLFESDPARYEKFLNDTIIFAENLVRKDGVYIDPDLYSALSHAYFMLDRKYELVSFKEKQKLYIDKALLIAPKKIDVVYYNNLANIQSLGKYEYVKNIHSSYERSDKKRIDDYFMGLGLYYSESKKESLPFLERFLHSTESSWFVRSEVELKDIYYDLMKYFYAQKDRDNLIIVLRSLATIGDQNQEFIKNLLLEIEDGYHLPYIKFDY